MHDFCFTIPYGFLLVVGGLVGYAQKGSVASLGGGVASGSLLFLAAYLSLNAFRNKNTSYLALAIETRYRSTCFHASYLVAVISSIFLLYGCIIQTVLVFPGLSLPLSHFIFCAGALTWIMGQRYIQTSKVMPAGIVAGISVLMTGFYLYKIATGGNHIPAKAE